VANGSFIVYNDTAGLSRSNGSLFLKKQMKGLLCTYSVNLRTNGREFDRAIHTGTVNICKVEKGVLGNMVVKYVKESLDPKFSNYKFQCPQPAGLVYFNNFPIFNIASIPRFIVIGAREEWEFSAMFRGKFAGVKSLVSVWSLKTYGVAVL
jgi:Protein of unknown function (DUF1091)